MGLIQLVSACVKELHLSNLVDAYAELVRAEAYSVTARAYAIYGFFSTMILLACIVAVVAVSISKNDK